MSAASPPSGPDDPVVLFFGDATGSPEATHLALACRFYGFRLMVVPPAETADLPTPLLAVVHAASLSARPAADWHEWVLSLECRQIPVAVVGITPDDDGEKLAQLAGVATVRTTAAGPSRGLWVSAIGPDDTGFELRGLRFPLGLAHSLGFAEGVPGRTLASLEPDGSRPVLVRLDRNPAPRYLAARTSGPDGGGPDLVRHTRFGEVAPLFLLLRDVGGSRCWHPPAVLANLTIDDPWLTEPYGCLSYPGLLAEMKRERFHATIGFVPWNFDRSSDDVVDLLRANRENFSLAVHGNNHDRYEFFRYTALPGDIQRPKPLAEQAFLVRQAMARMEAFQRRTGLEFDRVMVFPHGICPAATFNELKQRGYWATYNYNNVPLGENPPADPAVAARTINSDWYGFPAVRRAYPEKYPEEAIALDLFLGNPVMFMGHQDTFFNGIDAFTPYVRKVNARQPAVQWKGLGEISQHLHLLRWRDEGRCDVRLHARHARIENPRTHATEFRFAKREPDPASVVRVTLDGIETAWTVTSGEICFAATLPPGTSQLVEIHYRPPADVGPVSLRRSGFRRRALRLIADFRDLGLANSMLGRALTRKYYGSGKKRLTFGGLVSRLTARVRGDRPPR